MTDKTGLLPMPDGYDKYDPPLLYEGQMFNERQMQDYARANVAHAVAPLQVEIEALRAEVEQLAASEKACRRIANEKTLEAMVLRQQLAAAKAEIETLRIVLKAADNELDWLDEEMDTCDHSVGVCTCDYWDMRRKMKAALSRGPDNDHQG